MRDQTLLHLTVGLTGLQTTLSGLKGDGIQTVKCKKGLEFINLTFITISTLKVIFTSEPEHFMFLSGSFSTDQSTVYTVVWQ